MLTGAVYHGTYLSKHVFPGFGWDDHTGRCLYPALGAQVCLEDRARDVDFIVADPGCRVFPGLAVGHHPLN
jgi:hypothetical protein